MLICQMAEFSTRSICFARFCRPCHVFPYLLYFFSFPFWGFSIQMAEENITPNSEAPTYPATAASEASREMIEAGVFYGRKKSKTNPKMRQFVIANRGGIEVINLEKTEEALAL